MPLINSVDLFTDGGCRGNPGPGALGVIIKDPKGKLLHEHSQVLKKCTNNQAEYAALIVDLRLCTKFTKNKVCCFSDSQLIINQMNGSWRVRNDKLIKFYEKAKDREKPFKEIVYKHVNRTNPDISKADRILNDAFDGKSISISHK